MGKDSIKITGIDFTGVLQTLGMQKSTGVLRVDSTEDTHYFLYIEKGKIVGADSLPKRLDERLGNILLLQGLITKEELQNAIRLQKASKRKLGQILVKYGFVDKEVVEDTLRRQLMRIFYKLYTAPIKRYVFDSKEALDEGAKMIPPIPIENFLLEIATIIDELPDIRKEIPSEDVVFEVSPKFDPSQVELVSEEEANPEDSSRISSQELHVLNLVDGTTPVERILLKSPYNEFTTLKALWILKKKGFIVQSQEETEIATIIESMEKEPSGGRAIFLSVLSIIVLIASLGALFVARLSPFYTYIKDFTSYFIFR